MIELTAKGICSWINRKLFILKLKKASPSQVGELMRDKFYYLGKNVKLYTLSFGTEPYLISIHDNVQCAAGVRFINHDVSVFNMARLLGIPEETVDKVGSIVLKENCFVGAYSTLMPNTSVGRNSVVAACSVVTKHIPDGEVWGGVPAKFIMKTKDYAKKTIAQSNAYPWKDSKMSITLDELIKFRQDYFFGSSEKKE